jgi:hypothetical protein
VERSGLCGGYSFDPPLPVYQLGNMMPENSLPHAWNVAPLFEQNVTTFFLFYAINVTYPSDLCFSKLLLSLNVFNQHQIALLTGRKAKLGKVHHTVKMNLLSAN